ncbi:hypothetical protein BDW02DRAFT_635436, partial [Decorospora gaudefroyi]
FDKLKRYAATTWYVYRLRCAREHEDVVGRTRDQRWVCGARGRRDGLSLCCTIAVSEANCSL